MTRTLPPLNALKAFETAARHLSFKKAAEELNVTPGAVSHQIKILEESLKVELFHRMTRALRLTDAGLQALPLLSEGFDFLAKGVSLAKEQGTSDMLTISVSPSFGAMWLVPRLDHFRRLHPNIEIRIDGTDRLVELRRDGIDVALRYGPGNYRGLQVDHLFNQVNTPVCSPTLLKGKIPLNKPSDLQHHTLLHIDWKDTEASWRMWLLAAGLPNIDATQGPHYNMENMAVQAAIDGHGVALIGDILASEEISAGRLIRPFDLSMSTPLSFSYYLLTLKEQSTRYKISAFRHWLLEEASNASGNSHYQQPG